MAKLRQLLLGAGAGPALADESKAGAALADETAAKPAATGKAGKK